MELNRSTKELKMDEFPASATGQVDGITYGVGINPDKDLLGFFTLGKEKNIAISISSKDFLVFDEILEGLEKKLTGEEVE